jgi:hypothetical protein
VGFVLFFFVSFEFLFLKYYFNIPNTPGRASADELSSDAWILANTSATALKKNSMFIEETPLLQQQQDSKEIFDYLSNSSGK